MAARRAAAVDLVDHLLAVSMLLHTSILEIIDVEYIRNRLVAPRVLVLSGRLLRRCSRSARPGFAGITSDESSRFNEYFLTIMILHDYVIGTMEGDEVFLSRTKQPINLTSITSGDNMVKNRCHDERWRCDVR